MPNWCDNQLTVIGDVKEIARFKNEVQSETSLLSLNRLVPYPEEYRKLDEAAGKNEKEFNALLKKLIDNGKEKSEAFTEARKKFPRIEDGYNKGGYSWCCENWGTKWDLDNVETHQETDTEIKYEFYSAWAPPTIALIEGSKKFPTLKFKLQYEEPGMAFYGSIKFCNGETSYVEDGEMTPETHPEYFNNE